MPRIIEEKARRIRSVERINAIVDRIGTFLEKYPQFNHLSALSSRFMADWSATSLKNAMVARGFSEGDFAVSGKGQKYQTAEEMLGYLLTISEEEALEFLRDLRAIREVADMDNAILVEDEDETSEPDTATEDLI